MIGVDTNVLIRLLAPDDEKQNTAARSFFSDRSPDDPAYVSSIVLAETIWLLRRRLGYSRTAVEDAVRSMLASDDFHIEHGERLSALLKQGTPRAEIADYLIAWSADVAGCLSTVTFDKRSAKSIPSMELLA